MQTMEYIVFVNNMELERKDISDSHWCHQSFYFSCSECYKENRLLKARVLVNGEPITKEHKRELLKKYER